MRSALVVGAGLALCFGIVLGRVTARATRSWNDWKNAKAAVPVAKRTAYANAKTAALNWLLFLLIVLVLAATAVVWRSE